ncbi:hypothetical protein GCM10027289_19260 [Tsukamurella serpentis]
MFWDPNDFVRFLVVTSTPTALGLSSDIRVWLTPQPLRAHYPRRAERWYRVAQEMVTAPSHRATGP